jgi:hypothetical protein
MNTLPWRERGESLFAEGYIRVLLSAATLACRVHTVIIKGVLTGVVLTDLASSLLCRGAGQLPIESHLLRSVASRINAKVSLGTVASVAAAWLAPRGAATLRSVGLITAHFYVSLRRLHTLLGACDGIALRSASSVCSAWRASCRGPPWAPEGKAEMAALPSRVPIAVREVPDSQSAKVKVFLQCSICRLPLSGFSLMTDRGWAASS